MSRLETFLTTIDPIRTIDETEQRASQAINSFPTTGATIDDIGEFRTILGRFYWHCDMYILGIPGKSNPDPDFTAGLVMPILDNLYGANSLPVAFEMASSGVDGGLYRIIKDIAEHRVRYYNSNEVSTRVSAFISTLSPDERTSATQEYIQLYGHLLPNEITQGSGPLLASAKIHQLLCSHPDLIRRMRDVGRY